MRIGAQLYTLRMYTQSEPDLGRTLEKAAKIGYRTVQLSAIGPIKPKRVKELCDANGIKIVLTHNAEKKFLENIEELIEEHQLYGCKYVGLGSMAERYRSADWFDQFALDYEGPASKLKDAGLLFMYHNHAFEFSRLPDGRTFMDALLDRMPEEIMGITADTYWLQFAGVDVNEWLKNHAARLPCVHLKDMVPWNFESRMAPVGEGNINFPSVLDTLGRNGVTEYLLVEQDNCYDQSAFDCMKKSYDYLYEKGYR